MDIYELAASLAMALAVGLLIGIEREQSAPDTDDMPVFTGGVRTYPLFALAGALSAFLGTDLGVWFPAVVFASLMGLTAIGYVDDVRKGRDRGLTSEVAFAITFLLGCVAVWRAPLPDPWQRLGLVAGLGVTLTALLSAKPMLHRLVDRVSREDVYATVKFLIVVVIVLPLLPDRTFGPLDVLNPFNIGLMVALIAGIDFLGYVAVRLFGARKGMGMTGLLGGLVSSTAVTLSFSGRAKKSPGLVEGCALAIVTASTVMFPRVLVEVAVVAPVLLEQLALPLLLMTAAGVGGALVLLRRARKQAEAPDASELSFQNPFELSSALKFGAVFAVVLFGSKAATVYLGQGGTYLAGLLAGTTDVDAVTLSMAGLVNDGLEQTVAATTIVIATASNTIVKAGLAWSLGGGALGRRILAAFAVVFVAGAAGVALLWLG